MTRPGRLVLLGHPVSHSLSARFQDAALRAAGIPIRYEPLDVVPEALHTTLDALIAAGSAGNVTVPHKQSVYARCHTRTPLAERVGAVNTFWSENGDLVGDNTDVDGFDAAVRRAFGVPCDGIRVAVLGAGGGAAAVLAAVERWPGATAVLVSRSPARALSLAARFSRIATVAGVPADAMRDAGMVVNATPVGLVDDGVPVDPRLLDRDTLVFDLAYRRGSTAWVQLARARGLKAEDGLGMLIEQGALAFERWFGVRPDKARMWEAVA